MRLSFPHQDLKNCAHREEAFKDGKLKTQGDRGNQAIPFIQPEEMPLDVVHVLHKMMMMMLHLDELDFSEVDVCLSVITTSRTF